MGGDIDPPDVDVGPEDDSLLGPAASLAKLLGSDSISSAGQLGTFFEPLDEAEQIAKAEQLKTEVLPSFGTGTLFEAFEAGLFGSIWRSENALIDYALAQKIDLRTPLWRDQAIHALVNTHPDTKPRRRRGRPSKAEIENRVIYPPGTNAPDPNRRITLPDGFDQMDVEEFLKNIDDFRLEVHRLFSKLAPEDRPRRFDTDKNAATLLVMQQYNLEVNSEGFRAKVQYWRNTISKARQMLRKIKNN